MRQRFSNWRQARGAALLGLGLCWACTQERAQNEPNAAEVSDRKSERVREIERGLEALRQYETERREQANFATLAPSNQRFGSEPYRLVALSGGRVAVLLRGRDEIALLSPELSTLARYAAPKGACSLALDPQGDLFVAGELDSRVFVYKAGPRGLQQIATVRLPEVLGIRDIAVPAPGQLYAVEELAGRLLSARYRLPAKERREDPGAHPSSENLAASTRRPEPPVLADVQALRVEARGQGPLRLLHYRNWLAVNFFLEHRVRIYGLPQDVAGPGRATDPVEETRARSTKRAASRSPNRAIRHNKLRLVGEVSLDGPVWSFAFIPGQELRMLLGAAEDHPLDRTIGSFGNIDSFLYAYEFRSGTPQRIATFNLSERGVITPKAIVARGEDANSSEWLVTGYGNDTALELELNVSTPAELPAVASLDSELSTKRARAPFGNIAGSFVEKSRFSLAPGISAAVERADGAVVLANPLLDKVGLLGSRLVWHELKQTQSRNHQTDAKGLPNEHSPTERAQAEYLSKAGSRKTAPAGRSLAALAASESDHNVRLRLGEALFFTQLMAPENSSRGALSRFTCETCHFEGAVDGRVHHTGRGDIAVPTKPLLGLFNNRPHFSRALDPDLTQVAHAEFRVAGKNSGKDPWFELDAAQYPWLNELGVYGRLSPSELRRALLSYLMEATHRVHPRTYGRRRFTALERAGAAQFRDQCEICHQARLSADVEASRKAFEAWEGLVFSTGGPLVWARAEYYKTGVIPYVHERGARVPSLRRLYRKWPYLTNGSASNLDDVLRQVRVGGAEFRHQSGRVDSGEPLSALEQRQLRAFLDLL